MELFRFSSTYLDEQTEELKKCFEYLKNLDNIYPALIGEKLVLVKAQDRFNELGDKVSSVIVSTASVDTKGNFNGIPIPYKIDNEYNEIINAATADPNFDNQLIDSDTKRDVFVQSVKLQSLIDGIKSSGVELTIEDGKILLKKKYEILGEEGEKEAVNTVSL